MVVSNEVGGGIVPTTRVGRRFRDFRGGIDFLEPAEQLDTVQVGEHQVGDDHIGPPLLEDFLAARADDHPPLGSERSTGFSRCFLNVPNASIGDLDAHSALEALTRPRQLGFTVVDVDRRTPHVPSDLTTACALALNRLLPEADAPWHPRPPSPLRRRLRRTAWQTAIPLLALAYAADLLLAPLLTRTGGGNAYRVIARREPEA